MMGKQLVYIRPSDWWPEPIPGGHAFLLLKSISGTKHWQASRLEMAPAHLGMDGNKGLPRREQ